MEGVTKEVGGGVVKIADAIKKSPDVLEQVAVVSMEYRSFKHSIIGPRPQWRDAANTDP